jgi:hypothetical protein
VRRPALIVIDMLNDFLEKWSLAPKQQLVRSVNELVTLMRHFEHPVIWIRQEFEPDLRDAFLEMKRKGIRITVKGHRVVRSLQRGRTSHIYAEATSTTMHWASRDTTSSGTRINNTLSHDACSSRPLSSLFPVFAASV